MRTEDDLRAALTTLERYEPDAGRVLRAVGEPAAGCGRRARPGTRWRWWAPGLAAAMTVAIVAAIVTMSAPGGQVPVRPQAGPPAPAASAASALAARRALLAAAVKVSTAPLTTGRYWRSTTMDGNYRLVGTPADEYVLDERVADDQWTTRVNGDVAQYARSLGVGLASASDQGPWRRAGSPATWPQIGLTDGLADQQGFGSEEMGPPLRTAPTPLTQTFAEANVGNSGQTFEVGDRSLSERQLRALPADPAQLRKLFRPQPSAGPFAAQLFAEIPPVLTMPVTGAVRAVLYRIMATLPGVQSLGTVTDPAGRLGTAIAQDSAQQGCGDPGDLTTGNGQRSLFAWCTVQQELIINPATGMPLAMVLRYVRLPVGQRWPVPGQLFSYEVFQAAGWTSVPPPKGAGA